jgi:hypothetical protein
MTPAVLCANSDQYLRSDTIHMKNKDKEKFRVLSIYPTITGFGYSVFEGADDPIDWGVKSIRENKNLICLEKAERLIDFYSPDLVVTEDYTGDRSHRCERVKQLIDGLTSLCEKKDQKIRKFSKSATYGVFEKFGSFNKHEIAQNIARWFPSLDPYLPEPRKPWKSEDYRMGIFDSMALALTFFYIEK